MSLAAGGELNKPSYIDPDSNKKALLSAFLLCERSDVLECQVDH